MDRHFRRVGPTTHPPLNPSQPNPLDSHHTHPTPNSPTPTQPNPHPNSLLQTYDLDPYTKTATPTSSQTPGSPTDKKAGGPITHLLPLPTWSHTLLCLLDGCLTALHPTTHLPLSSLPETKGLATLYTTHPDTQQLCLLLPKPKKLLLVTWEGGRGLRVRREISLAACDSIPRAVRSSPPPPPPPTLLSTQRPIRTTCPSFFSPSTHPPTHPPSYPTRPTHPPTHPSSSA